MRKITITTILLSFVLICFGQRKKETQAVLGVKEGGDWEWVTKESGKQQYEYKGGEFELVSSLKVAEEHTDHSFDIQFEGPGWESNKIAFRLYLDWRNAVDIFGKKEPGLVLHSVGVDGFDSYHEMSDWGVDVLKVGSSLGLGAIAFWDGKRAIRVEKTSDIHCAVKSSDKKSQVSVDYSNWEINGIKTDLYTLIQIEAGSYLSEYNIKLSESLPNIATGIVKHENAEIEIVDSWSDDWGCLISFGKQTLQEDHLGMCIFYRKSDLIEVTEDEHSHVLVLRPNQNELSYYFGAAWEQDESQVKDMDDFKKLLREQIKFVK